MVDGPKQLVRQFDASSKQLPAHLSAGLPTVEYDDRSPHPRLVIPCAEPISLIEIVFIGSIEVVQRLPEPLRRELFQQ